MSKKLKRLLIKFTLLTSLYNAALGIWSGTIYLFMRHIQYTYADINVFLSVFWIVTFFSELPSGILADKFGRINVFILSCLTRSIGLLFLFFDTGDGWSLIISAILTALGDSLYSGTLDSWFIDKAKFIDKNYQINNVFSLTTSISTAVSLISGFIGAQFLANINLGYPILAGAILLLCPIPFAWSEKGLEQRSQLRIEDFKQSLSAEIINLKSIKAIIRNNKSFFLYSLSFLPITLIVTGPYNQWQLFFQQGLKTVQTGWILIGVNFLGVLGAYIAGYLLKMKRQIMLLTLLSFINAGTIIFASSVGVRILAIMLFWVHVLFTSSDEVVRYTILHKQVNGAKRTTLISINNTLNAAATLIALGINGWLSDAYSIGLAWTITAIAGLLLTIAGYLTISYVTKKSL
ncbi:permease of the major facilitator superfamily protein [Liquorilactobacillus ghanensis DSM 18630]|uniref:Permease of the major facilitator superfamily protein n=1 Tax=Liquorilactobacillus ghanensis DSM 18630 TaxID=1423750 RepID=A0A0R1VM29_9LACO|nr:MFS transporter [Liquorilactobacillus ghanensis]KRM06381.1 permease of the major facilitator superfamily protein [Liquorilactobacillus ghanensis DSM 18630]